MQLSPETRKRAVEAFKNEISKAIEVIRTALAESASDWEPLEIKQLLHRLKGGAGFLGYESLTISIAELEHSALECPSEPQEWLRVLNTWESELDSYS